MLKLKMHSSPFRCVFVADALAACRAYFDALYGGEPFTAAVLDCAMRGKDGFVPAAVIRAWEAGENRMRFAALTAFDEIVVDTTLLKKYGFEKFFRKDRDLERLPELITEWLGASG
ncbi:MAG TPA: hypothetical protein VF507_04665 [Pyrinomonadaceae bacterium]